MFETLKKIMLRYRQTLLYLFFGGATFVVSQVTYTFFALLWYWSYTPAYLLSWFLAVLFAYVTNRIWVFRSQVRDFLGLCREVWRFYLARIVTGIFGWFILAFGVQVLGQNDLLWNFIQNVFVIITNYVLSKFFIFQKQQGE
ncbi:GtrA family protein [Leuconostocaceae bacterium ESL0958]|nr:GtrA family protein [Leuconostocaceae bacterium ESL0958]